MQPQLGIRKRFIGSLSGVDGCSLSWGSGRGLLEVYEMTGIMPVTMSPLSIDGLIVTTFHQSGAC